MSSTFHYIHTALSACTWLERWALNPPEKLKVHRFSIDLPLCSFVFKFALTRNPWTTKFDLLFLTPGCIQLLESRPWSNFSGCESFLWLERKPPENFLVLPNLLMNKDSAALESSRFQRTRFWVLIVHVGQPETSGSVNNLKCCRSLNCGTCWLRTGYRLTVMPSAGWWHFPAQPNSGFKPCLWLLSQGSSGILKWMELNTCSWTRGHLHCALLLCQSLNTQGFLSQTSMWKVLLFK